jgi:hypothetical protein
MSFMVLQQVWRRRRAALARRMDAGVTGGPELTMVQRGAINTEQCVARAGLQL